jgi:hypothetical protein
MSIDHSGDGRNGLFQDRIKLAGLVIGDECVPEIESANTMTALARRS